jgi:hypothetical protein
VAIQRREAVRGSPVALRGRGYSRRGTCGGAAPARAPGARERYAERWQGAQRRFVDHPAQAVGEADSLVSAVMSERGYPVSDEFDQRAADISVDHPVVVEHYRAAHDISLRTTAGEATTEDLRQAMVHFRALFDELLGREERFDREEREPTHATKETT